MPTQPRQFPGLGLTGDWAFGFQGWDNQMDDNLRLLSAVAQLTVLDTVAAVPGTPTNGDVYILSASAGSNPNRVAVYDEDQWVYFIPKSGWRAYRQSDNKVYTFDGTSWTTPAEDTGALPIATYSAAHTLALSDAGSYVRMDVAADHDLTVPTNAQVAFPIGTQILIRQVGAGKTTLAASGSVSITTAETLALRKQNSSASLIKVGTDAWELSGDLEAL